jgi:hypothetical protein
MTEGKLTQEHVVPFGLNGEHILLHASCLKCAQITSKIELRVLRGTFISIRRHLNLRSRHTKAWEDPKDFFSTLLFPITELPAHLSRKEYSSGVNIKGVRIIPLSEARPKPSTTTFHGHDFERMLAKIGLGFSVGHYGIDAFASFYILPTILGECDNSGRWIGMAEDEILTYGDTMYNVNISEVDGEVICRIKLFAMYKVPEYLVVIGKLKAY